MNRPEVWQIDWKEPLSRLQPYIAGQGGVVLVSGFATSACNSFIKLVRDAIRKDDAHNLCVQLDPYNETTRTVDDILAILEDKLSLPAQMSASISALTDNVVKGNMEVSGVNIYNVADPAETPSRRILRINRLVKTIEQQVRIRRIVLILYNYHMMQRPGTATWFWQQLWMNRLANLVKFGLLVICAFEAEDGSLSDDDPLLSYDCEIRLPSVYDGAAREEALRDVTEHLMASTKEEQTQACKQAERLLTEWRYLPSRTQARIAFQLKFNLHT